MVEDETQDKQTNEQRWGWYHALIYLSKEDILKIDEITQQPFMKVFNFLTYTKWLDKKREQELQKQLKK